MGASTEERETPEDNKGDPSGAVPEGLCIESNCCANSSERLALDLR
jgi:hypothetical protein